MSTQPTIAAEFEAAFPGSRAAHARALHLFPSGITHDTRRADPFPLTCTHGEGAYKWDVDGHRLLDYAMAHGGLLLGHSHPAVVEAVRAQAGTGLQLGASTLVEAEWARRIIGLVPCAEHVRFTSSGTEATLLALRVARAATGRSRVVKLAGHYHGWHDDALPGTSLPVSALPPPGSPPNPNLIVVPQGDLAAMRAALAGGDVAAVILEPTGAAWGAVPLAPAAVAAYRELCDQHGTLLVFDEVVTGFRWSARCAQDLIGVTPDLTALAKVVAGGLPGGAIAGPADLLAVLAFRSDPALAKVEHYGTYNAHPLAAAAGTVTLDLLADGALIGATHRRAAELRAALGEVFARVGTPGYVYGQASTFIMLLDPESDDPVVLKRGIKGDRSAALHCAMLLEGVHLYRGCGLLSIAHGDEELQLTVSALERSLRRMQAQGVIA